MKRFTDTKFFLALPEMLQRDTDTGALRLKSLYDEFVALIISEKSRFQNHTAYRNALVYTVSRLTEMTRLFQKKSSQFF
jgi:hypothetical protein